MTGESPRVLLVYGDEDSRWIYSTILLHHGIAMVTARDGDEVVRLALAESPKLVLVDVDIGLTDLSELAKRIRTTWPHATLVRVRYPVPGPVPEGDREYDHVFDKPPALAVMARWIQDAVEATPR